MLAPTDPNEKVAKCKCCKEPIWTNQVPLCTGSNSKDFGYLGSAFPCYYMFVKYCGYLLIAMFLLCGIYNAATNIGGDYCVKKSLLEGNGTLSENDLCKVSFF